MKSFIFVFLIAVVPALSFAQGLVPETAESLKDVKQTPARKVTLPPSVDLSQYMPTPGNQGPQGACVSWAVAYARAYYQVVNLKSSDRRRLKDEWNVPSPSYIYRSTINTPNNCNSGSSVVDALKLLQNHGVAAWAALPHNPKDCSPLSPAQVAAGKGFRIYDFEHIANYDYLSRKPIVEFLDNIKAELAEGNPVIFTMHTTDAFDQLKKGAIYNHPTTCSRTTGCEHAVVFVGYDDKKQAFKLLNSWGTEWADGGFGWIAYETARAEAVSGAFVIQMEQAKPRIVKFWASMPPNRIQTGEIRVVLQWDVRDADTLEIPDIGDLTKRFLGSREKRFNPTILPSSVGGTKSGIVAVTLSGSSTFTFTIKAENARGTSTATVDVVVPSNL